MPKEFRLSLYDYMRAIHVDAQTRREPFYTVLAVAFRRADTDNLRRLREAFPGFWESHCRRDDTPGGIVGEWDN